MSIVLPEKLGHTLDAFHCVPWTWEEEFPSRIELEEEWEAYLLGLEQSQISPGSGRN